MEYKNLVDVITARANSNSGITFIESSLCEEKLTYKELYDYSLKVLYNLQQKGALRGNEIVIQLNNNRNFIIAFWACILGGYIPVPVSIPKNHEQSQKTINIWKCLSVPYLITSTQNIVKLTDTYGLADFINNFRDNIFVENDLFEANDGIGDIFYPEYEGLAYIQFSSGSTGAPKGIKVTHKNVIVNSISILKGLNLPLEGDRSLSWMPLTHDMGLIGYHITPTLAGYDHFIMSTELFIRRPSLWLQKISDHKITNTASSNFGLKYLIANLDNESCKNIDLSSLRVILNGAEPISHELCTEFVDRLIAYGLKRNVILPVYGLAEASLAVTFCQPEREIQTLKIKRNFLNIGDCIQIAKSDEEGITLIELGQPIDNCNVKIFHNRHVVPENIIGNIYIKGDNVTSGYYNNEKITKEIIDIEEWLNTGDVGFIHDKSLFVIGREKDIIQINECSYYSHDLEMWAEKIKGIEIGKIVFVAHFNNNSQKKEIIVFVLNKGKSEDFIPIAINLKRDIIQNFGFEIEKVIQVKEIPKTTSGKIQRYKLQENYNNGSHIEVL